MQRLEQALTGIVDGYAPWVAPHREEITRREVSFAQHSGNELHPTHYVDNGDSKIIAIPYLKGYFNPGAWLNGTTHLLARKVVDLRTITDHTPDVGTIESLTMDENNVITPKRVIWRPGDTVDNLEDARVADLGSKDGRAAVGFTAVSVQPDANGYYPFYPARAYVDRTNPTRLEGLKVIRDHQGKNMTPLNVPGEEDKWWGFRRYDKDHELQILYDDGNKFRAAGTLSLPKNMPGFSYRAGPSAPPDWEDEQNGILPLHGIDIKEGLYIYSLRIARIVRNKTSQDQPFTLINPEGTTLHPDNFNSLRGEDPMAFELHPKIRRAVYSTGAVVHGDTYRSFVSIGDTVTVVVDQNLPKLREGFRTENKAIEIYHRS